MSGKILPVVAGFALLILTGCPFEPPPFDNPIDPRNQGDLLGGDSPGFDYAVGDLGPAGGFIFFVDELDAHAGWTFLEAASADIDGFLWDENATPAFLGVTATEIGEGLNNTQETIAILGTGIAYAARSADEHSEGGFDDWFLPSLDELETLYVNLLGTRDLVNDFGFTTTYYWSSSEVDDANAWTINFFNGDPLSRQKDAFGDPNGFPLRPIRRF